MSKATTISKEAAIATIVDVLRLRAETQRDEVAYRFLADGEEERGTLTYGELYRRARRVAAELQKHSAAGERALLLDASEAGYIVTFFGCLCAGVIAVPIYAPRLNKKGNARVESVVADAQPSVVLTAGAGSPAVRDVITASAGEHVKWIDTSALPADGDELWTPPAVRGTDIAFLQYTSGSTAAPKGVMVSHANILDNERMIQNAFDTKPGSVIVGWLPLFHDMGLIGNVLQPLYAGVPCILMSPVAFLQRPLRWLQAISRYQATTSGGPNFAYELCLRKIRPEDRSGLDLSSWRVAFNGAEPVRLETVNRFAAQFAGCGFRREAFVPCYGLAEATLFVSGGLDPNGVTAVNPGTNGNSSHSGSGNGGSGNGAKISRKQGQLLVASGRPPVEQAVRIVSPDSLRPSSAGDVGEIWISGPSVAQGYWRKAKETEETFKARIPEMDEGPFLRTGDLGFLKDGHLFITGRLKDLLIIRGQNYYPQDIELTVEQSHPVLQPGSGAAFSVEIEGEERLVVVQEVAVRKHAESVVQSDLDELDALIKLISRNIVAGHELQAFAIVLIRKGTILKTSSGKIQRHACRDAFLNRELYVLREWQERKQPEPVLAKPSHPELDGQGASGLALWVAQEISRTQGIEQERVDLNQPFAAYGLDSLAAIEFAHKLQAEFQIEVDVAEFFSDSTITEVIRRATKNTQSPVRKVEKEPPRTYPLSYGQRALWFVQQTAPESAAYNIARVMRIATGLDVDALRLAFQALVNRHPCLRTTVVETAGEPVQQVAEKVEVCFEYFDVGDWSQAELEKALVQQSRRPFSLTLGPLFRAALYARSEKEYLLHLAVHHLVADYWSLTLLLDEMGKLYQAFTNKVGAHLVRLEYSYADFVEWQREKLSGAGGERLRDYWKSELAGELPPLSLPADHIRPPAQTFRGASLPFSLDARLTKALKRLGEEQQATLFTTLLAAFQVLLYRLTSQKQVIVGCPIAGRSRAEFANIAGYFVNTMPLRADFEQRQTFTELLAQVRNRVAKGFAHELYPFAFMVEQLGIVRDLAVPPIFQSAFVFQQTYGSRSEDFVRFALGQPQAQVKLGGLQLEHVALEQRTAQFDLTLTAGEGPDGMVGAWEYSSDLFETDTIARWAECFSVLLEGIVSNPEISVSQLPILSGSQYGQLVEELNRTKLEYDSGQCLHELIAEQAKRKPAGTAIVYRETELSYRELNERANQVARYLLRAGVGKEDLVGVCMRRSPEMVVAMLGIWKANAAYVPLDPQYPEERLRLMLEDAEAKAVITEESLKERVGGTSATVLSWDGAREQIDKESKEKVGRPASSLQLAYLIYTSGSSGVPKGVMLTHRNAVSFVTWARQTFTEEEFSGVLAATSICFDLSIYELWATLSCGGTVVLADDVINWWESLQGGRVTNRARLLNTVPSAAAQLIEQGPLPEGVVTINLAGEALKEELVSGLWQRGNLKRVNNLYGPTETTTYSSWTPVEAEKKVTIGRGVGNTRLYVLDQELELAPLGVVGELYIAGAGVGRGYWGRASLTAERFLPDPYSKTGDRMYRTGDLVRWNNAGQMEYLGRADQQVKVRGYRIELGEIEAAVSGYPAVRESVVVVRESGRDRLLVAYTAPRAGMEINQEQLREYLEERLPRYMLPSKFVILESLPKTPNGKVDRKALPEPQQGEVKSRKPRSETEEMVAAIWAQVLQLDQVGMEENFFGLGGHSLLAMQVMSRIRQVFAVEFELRSFLENPTVAALALLVDKAARTAMPPLLPLPRSQPPRLSFAQERLWFLARYETEAGLYNVPIAVRLRGELNIEAAQAGLQEIVNRHEVLRTSFPEVGDSTIQDIAAEMAVPFATAEVREDELDQVLREQARRPFDLGHGPLIRASLFRIGSQDHVLLVVMHHIVSDGWSLGVMLGEFNALYDAFSRGAVSPLPPLSIQYADYSEWQREWLQGEVLERQLDYWRKQLAGHETLNLPTDRPYPARPTLAGAMEKSRLPEPLLSKLKLFSDQQGVTLFMTLLAGFEILLYRYTGQTDISVGSAIANRSRQELESLIGFFLNTLVLRTQFTEDSSVAELLQRVRDVSLQAYAHQDIPFERLVEALHPVRELGRTPFFQVLFALHNIPLPKVTWNGLEATAGIVETGTAKFDLTLSAREEDGELELSLEYRTELFNAERMKRLLEHYRTLLEGIVVSVDARIGELEIAGLLPLDTMPLTANGKADHKALLELENKEAMEEAGSLALTPTEELIAGVWLGLLGKSEIRRHDNFFDLGGHSLTSIQMLARVEKVFHREIELRAIFEFPALKDFSAYVDQLTGPAPLATLRPIVPAARDGNLPLSFAQQRLWFLARYEAEASLYNVPIAVRLRGELNIEAAQAGLQEIVNRHEVLRTSFPEVGDSTIQDIAAEMAVPFATAEVREDELDQVLREQARRPFDLGHGPLIRASLFRIGSQDHVLLVVMHHIVSDGWSMGVMLGEFNALYDSFSRGVASPLPPLPIQYADYSAWQREWLQGEVLERQLDYWRNQLAGHETLSLPTDRPYPARPTLAGAMEKSRLPEPLLSKLKLFSDRQGVTLFMTLLAGFEILLYRYTGQTDISVGLGIANRNRQELEPLIGFFVNTLVLRTQFTEDSSVAELLQRVRDVSLQAYAHQDIPFERLVEALDPVRELGRTPFFQALFALHNIPLPKVTWNGLEATAGIVETGTAKFDLTLSAREEDGELELSLEYRTELFNAERMKRLLEHYRTLLEGIVVSMDARIGELDLLSEPERRQLLVEWHRTESPYWTNQCVHELFEEQAAKTPQAVVVVDEDEDGQISYAELNRRANQLAHYLVKMGVVPEVRVGICSELKLEMLLALMGILKAGGVCVPLDPVDPAARRSHMLKDAGARIVLTNERLIQQMAECAEHVVDLKEAREEIEKQSGENLRLQLDPENLAWVIYSSSSTGRPKGMAIPHRSAASVMQQRTLIDAMDQNPSVERLLNLYAPTEDTTYATYAEVKLDEQAYVLDGHMKLAPVGIKGELYIGGAGQARGYLNRPELTAEQFVPNPFSKTGGERLYRTGDLVRYRENGNLEFLGRLDDQVKIHGYRIEPGEIEAAVLDYPGVTQAAVIARENKPGDVRLAGYVAGSERLDVDRLRSHLQQRVPEYMVPAALLQLDTMPLTANGKVDRKALLELESKEPMDAGSLTLTATEELIAGVWSSLLGKSEIRRDDNFFDLGGHSLTSIQMLARVEKVFHREIESPAIFEFPVLKDFSAYVDQLTGPAPLATLRPIVPAARDGNLPLSFAQQRLWFLAQMEGASAAYHIPFGLHLKGDLNRTALRRALDRIVVRHEVLRTTFALRDGEPAQEIGAIEESSFRLIEHDLRGHKEAEAELAALRELEAGAPFDLAAGPLIRGRLIRLAEDEHVLLITMHHIVSDGWSMGVLVRELNALYGAYGRGEADPLPELEIQYADYAVWQRQWIEGEILQQQAAYWKTTLAGAPALLELPADHTRPIRRDFAGGFVELVLDEQLTAGLKDLSRRHGTTLYMTLLTGWAILLARLSGQQDVVIGSPVANRGRAEIENLIGFFVNTLALHLDLSGSPRVSELLQQAKAQSLAAQRHQDIPFEQVVELAQPVRSLAHSPLFQVMFAWQDATESLLELPGLELQPFVPSSHRVAKFDMTLSLQAAGDTIGGGIEYASALFEAASVHRYIGYFLALLKAMVTDDAQTIDRLPMVSEGEREQVLYGWNETQAEFPGGKCVHELFEEQAARTPQAAAVIYEEERLNYGELNERANRLAWRLRELGVGPETIVGLMVERSIEMVVALLGVLKAGAAYVPLDPGSTRERLQYMVEDSGARLVLTSGGLSSILSAATDVEVLTMEAEEWLLYSGEEPRVSVDPSQLAYVIYTSGSTGRPKGVGVEHRQLVNYVQAIGRKLQIEPGARLGLVSTFAADLGYTMIFPALCHGGCLDVVDADRVLDAGKLEEHFSRHPIDYLKIVPSHMRALLNSNAGSGFLPRRWLILGGEASSWDLIEQVKGRGAGCQVLNHYGPTETTVGVLTCDTTSSNATQDGGGQQAGGMVPIGRPLSNGKVYVLDSELNPVGVGVSGEICIAGAGVARGYLKRAELTAEKFLANPYSAEPGGRMYRTGDLGRYLENGNVEFLGRRDHQVKIRGFRIELGEIEARLAEHPAVREAVVLATEDAAGEKRLVAYVVPERESEESSNGSGRVELQMSELREHLLGKLPEYMVPTAYVRMERIPLTPNGKLDRKSLPEPDKDIREQEYVGPRNATEETLCHLWQEVLRRELVGIHDNFFNIGGHSLLAVQVISRIRQAFAIEMPLSVLFAAPTVARMAEHVAAVNEPGGSQSSPVLVNIQPHGSWPPFFCVHAVGGQVISYAELSQELGLEQPFYGLQSPPANYFSESDISIEQLATLYNQQIRSVQPVGPYLLSGWSMGGLVAWEMAQQLMKEGETISLLALIDTAPPPRYREAEDRADEISMLARFAMDMSRLVGRDPGPLVEQFLQAAEQDQWKMVQETLTNYGVLAPKTAHAEMTALLDVFTRNFRAMKNYSIPTSKQAVVYFRASETPERFSKVWTKWSGGGIQFHSVPGDHFTMLRRPGVRIIAETLRRYLSMNSNNELRAVSPEMSPRELTDIESRHTA